MSLKIFRSISEIPEDMEFIYDVDPYLVRCGIEDNEFNRAVLRDIELGGYLDKESFVDRFGFKLRRDCLSTSSIILMCINSFPDKVFNGMEIGRNVGKHLFSLKNGYILLPREDLGVTVPLNLNDPVDVDIDGVNFKDSKELSRYIQEVLK